VTSGQVESISSEHITDEFDCGSEAQTTWLRKHALQAHRTDTSKVRVVTRVGDKRVAGYYALAAGSVALEDAPPRVAKGMPRYPVPVVILTRLGVDRKEQGRGVGRALFRDALLRVASAAEEIAARAVLIHCEGETAKAFYLRFGEFEESPTDPLHLFLLLSDLRKSSTGGRSRQRSSGSIPGHPPEEIAAVACAEISRLPDIDSAVVCDLTPGREVRLAAVGRLAETRRRSATA
jgi:GNAT superfamily N-acetyltransferase